MIICRPRIVRFSAYLHNKGWSSAGNLIHVYNTGWNSSGIPGTVDDECWTSTGTPTWVEHISEFQWNSWNQDECQYSLKPHFIMQQWERGRLSNQQGLTHLTCISRSSYVDYNQCVKHVKLHARWGKHIVIVTEARATSTRSLGKQSYSLHTRHV